MISAKIQPAYVLEVKCAIKEAAACKMVYRDAGNVLSFHVAKTCSVLHTIFESRLLFPLLRLKGRKLLLTAFYRTKIRASIMGMAETTMARAVKKKLSGC